MPPCARSRTPARSLDAPTPLPFTHPKSSASSSVSGMSPHDSTTSGSSRRALAWCSARANRDRPEPGSPITSVGASMPATRSTSSRNRLKVGLSPISSGVSFAGGLATDSVRRAAAVPISDIGSA